MARFSRALQAAVISATPHAALLVGERCLDLVLELLDLGDARLLVGVLESGLHGGVEAVDLGDNLGDGLVELVGLGLDGALVEELLLLLAEAPDGLWAKSSAPIMSSSVTSSAPHSTMEMYSLVPATVRLRSEASASSKVGLTM